MMILKTLRFIADRIDGEVYEYDDGYVIEVKTGTEKVIFTYSLDGDLEKTEVKI